MNGTDMTDKGVKATYVEVPLHQSGDTSTAFLPSKMSVDDAKAYCAALGQELLGKATCTFGLGSNSLKVTITRGKTPDQYGKPATTHNDDVWRDYLLSVIKPAATAKVDAHAYQTRDGSGKHDGTIVVFTVMDGVTTVTNRLVTNTDGVLRGRVGKNPNNRKTIRFSLSEKTLDEDAVAEAAQHVADKLGLLITSGVPVNDEDKFALNPAYDESDDATE